MIAVDYRSTREHISAPGKSHQKIARRSKQKNAARKKAQRMVNLAERAQANRGRAKVG